MDRIARFQRSKNFVLFYGAGKEEALSTFDLAIVEPKGQSKSGLQTMHTDYNLVLAYLSLVEISPQEEEFALLNKEDFIQIDRKPVRNLDFGNYLVDPRSDRWRKIVVHRAGKLLTQLDYDGLFFDTIGDLEYLKLPSSEQNTLMIAGAHLVREIREFYPTHILIQNNGIEQLSRLTAPFVNGYCWENPPFDRIINRTLIENLLKQQQILFERYQSKLLLLFEQNYCRDATIASVRDYLKRNNLYSKDFLIYISPPGYSSGIIKAK